MVYRYVDSPIGPLLVAGEDDHLMSIAFPRGGKPAPPESGWSEKRSAFRTLERQLGSYFKGRLQEFDLELAPVGTQFQQKVWRQLQRIPYGTTISYGELARRIGNPKASRAVGAANGQNPLSIVIPCHRVIGSTGKLTGFGGGLDVKQALLSLESRDGQAAFKWRR